MDLKRPWQQYIQPAQVGAKPRIIGTDIHPLKVVGLYATGCSVNEILGMFPELSEYQVQACLDYSHEAANLARSFGDFRESTWEAPIDFKRK